jgi:hypothetical protein
VAESLAARGDNLPSGTNLTEESNITVMIQRKKHAIALPSQRAFLKRQGFCPFGTFD